MNLNLLSLDLDYIFLYNRFCEYYSRSGREIDRESKQQGGVFEVSHSRVTHHEGKERDSRWSAFTPMQSLPSVLRERIRV